MSKQIGQDAEIEYESLKKNIYEHVDNDQVQLDCIEQ